MSRNSNQESESGKPWSLFASWEAITISRIGRLAGSGRVVPITLKGVPPKTPVPLPFAKLVREGEFDPRSYSVSSSEGMFAVDALGLVQNPFWLMHFPPFSITGEQGLS